jgi:hypothetical protein
MFKLIDSICIVREQGLRWVLFRLLYAGRHTFGILRHRLPRCTWESRPLKSWLVPGVPWLAETYVEWRRAHRPEFFFKNLDVGISARLPSHFEIARANAIMEGRWPYFSGTEIQIGFPPDWHFNPANGKRVPMDRHWSDINDFEYGDIKFVWEASRFTVAYTLARAYAASGDERYSSAFWTLVEDWAEHNPPHSGSNWKCGQEAAFRIMAWCFGLFALAASPHSTPSRVTQLVAMLAFHAERIEGNIAYALSQNNNHVLSEAAGLWTVGLLFPELARASHWRKKGKQLLEEQISKQILSDGSYVQQSTNYHRLMLHDLLWAFRLGELNNDRFSRNAYDSLAKAVEFLAAITDPVTGRTPNQGNNDGALLLALNNCDFNDYRPVLQAASYLLRHRRLFPAGPWDEDLLWLFGADALQGATLATSSEGSLVFAAGGYHVLRGPDSWALVRCARHRSRPAHADQLHLDLWWRGENIAADAGTYLYNGDLPWRNGLAQTAVHNTVTADRLDQMTRVSHFLWTRWSEGTIRFYSRDEEGTRWEGEHNGYRRRLGVTHRRAIFSRGDVWTVIDDVLGAGRHVADLHWLLPDVPHRLDRSVSSIELDTSVGKYRVQFFCSLDAAVTLARAGQVLSGNCTTSPVRGWISRYYGRKEPVLSLSLKAAGILPVRFVTVFSPRYLEPHALDCNRVRIRSDQKEVVLELSRLSNT